MALPAKAFCCKSRIVGGMPFRTPVKGALLHTYEHLLKMEHRDWPERTVL